VSTVNTYLCGFLPTNTVLFTLLHTIAFVAFSGIVTEEAKLLSVFRSDDFLSVDLNGRKIFSKDTVIIFFIY